jgi:glutathione S-transferase
MTRATLTISSKNYSAWSLRGWLMARFAGLPFEEEFRPQDHPESRAELLLMAPSVRVPRLRYGQVDIWDTLALGEYLAECYPEKQLLPQDVAARAHCRSICGEMHSGFASLRSALPMNLKAYFPNFAVWSRAFSDIERVTEIWRDCLQRYGGPYLFGTARGVADAMYAPVVTRFLTYDVPLDDVCINYCATIMSMPEMQEWLRAAQEEEDDIDELEVEL